MPTYFIYARKSTESDDRQALSIEAQVDELKRYAEVHRLTIAEIFRESKSAKRSGRPVFAAMLKALRNPDISGILCWKLDRLSRNLADAALLSEAMDDGLVDEIRTPSQTFKNTSIDRFMSGMEWLVGRKYIDDLSENVKRGLRAKVEHGWYPGLAPVGYVNDRNHPQGQRRIVKDPEKFDLVQKLWDLMLTGQYSVPAILQIANTRLGLTTRQGRYPAGRPLSRAGLYKIFSNIFYCGQFEYQGEVHEGKHDAMVTLEEYDRVQDLLGRKGRPRPKQHRFTFTGMIRCGQCGASVTAEEKFKLIKSTGERRRYVYYHCTHNLKTPCRQGSITEPELKRQVGEFLSRLTIPKEFLDFVLTHLEQFRGEEHRSQEQAIASVKKGLTTIQRRLDNLLALKISPGNESGEWLSDQEFVEQKAILLRRKRQLNESLLQGASSSEKVAVLTKETFEFATYARLWFANGAPEKQRSILSKVGSNHKLLNGNLLISAKEPLAVIERRLPRFNSDSGGVEPAERSSSSPKNGSDVSPNLSWCGVVDDVRTAIEKELIL